MEVVIVMSMVNKGDDSGNNNDGDDGTIHC